MIVVTTQIALSTTQLMLAMALILAGRTCKILGRRNTTKKKSNNILQKTFDKPEANYLKTKITKMYMINSAANNDTIKSSAHLRRTFYSLVQSSILPSYV